MPSSPEVFGRKGKPSLGRRLAEAVLPVAVREVVSLFPGGKVYGKLAAVVTKAVLVHSR